MSTTYERKLLKIYNKINKIATVGKDNILEYYKYINELIEKEDYSKFEQVLFIYYNYDVSKKESVDSYKLESWDIICSQTKSSFLQSLKDLYDKRRVYQQSYNIYDSETGIKLGEIIESETYTNTAKYLVKNKEYARLVNELTIHLKVNKHGETNWILIDDVDPKLSFERNLIKNYNLALDHILS